jgi:ribose transport system permease protein
MTEAIAATPPREQTGRIGRGVLDEYRVELAMLGVLALLCLGLSVFAENFLTEGNIRNVVWQVTAIGIIAIGQTLIILTAGIDLSVGGIVALSAMVGGKVMVETDVATGIAVTVGVAMLVGLLNGVLIAYFKLAAFIVTLGMLSVCTSLTYVISDQTSITGLSDAYRTLGRGKIGSIQYYILIFLGLYVVFHVLLTRSKPGRYIYAIGSNEEAARLSGVDVRLYKAIPYVVTGFLCGVAALILSGRLGVIDPDNGPGRRAPDDRGGRHRRDEPLRWEGEPGRDADRGLPDRRAEQRAEPAEGGRLLAGHRGGRGHHRLRPLGASLPPRSMNPPLSRVRRVASRPFPPGSGEGPGWGDTIA